MKKTVLFLIAVFSGFVTMAQFTYDVTTGVISIPYNPYSADFDNDGTADVWQGGNRDVLEDAVFEQTSEAWGLPAIGETFYVTIKGTANFTGKLKLFLVDEREEAGYFTKVADANGEFDIVSGEPFEAVTVLVVTNNSICTNGDYIGTEVAGGLTAADLVFTCEPTITSTMDGFNSAPPMTIATTEFSVLWEAPISIENPIILTSKGMADQEVDGYKYQGLIKATDVTAAPAGFVNVTITGTAVSDIATLLYSLIDQSVDAQPKAYFSDVVEGGFTTIATDIKEGDTINVSFSLPVAADFVPGATPDYQNAFLAQDPAEKSSLYLSNVAVEVSFSALPLNQSDYTTFEVDGIYYSMGETGLSVCNSGNNLLYSGSITIPSSVTYEDKTYQVTAIRDYAFNDCTGLTSITIPESVTSIGRNAFSGCTGLTSITIPASVTTIPDNAFSGCTSITNITTPLFDRNVFTECTGLTSITIPEGVTTIPDSAFYNCAGLTNITIPESVTSIGSCAFQECSGLTNITIPQGVTTIANNAFCGCKGLTNITIPEGVTTIPDSAFYNCAGLTNITIPESVTSIGHCAFMGCSGLTNITIPQGVTIIAYNAFACCSGLTNITILEGLTTISNGAFALCTGLTSITIPESVATIGKNAFYSCSELTSITIPEGVTTIDEAAFMGCSGLTNVTIPESVTTIGAVAFCRCSGLTSIAIPERVTSIGVNAFQKCTGLTSVTIPESVTTIGSYAFDECTGLTSITIPEGITTIAWYTFRGCTGLTNVTIPEGVTIIDQAAFMGCSGLTNITIPESVTTIGGGAFSGCSGLTNLTWNVKNYNKSILGLFQDSPNISSFIFGNNVETIPAYCCCNLSKLTNINISESVTSIGESAFSGCSGLQYIVCNGEPAECGENVFGQEGSLAETKIYAYVSLLVPNEYKKLYSIMEPWSKFSITETETTADTIEIANDSVTITAKETQVLVTWPQIDNSNSYTLVITVAGEVYITLNFNANGQLIGLDLPSSKSYTGLQFTVNGLNTSTNYAYSLEAKDVNDNVLKSYTGSFKTLGETAITEVGEEQNTISVINNTITCTGESFKIYNVLGQNVTAENGNLKAGVYMVVTKYGSQKVVVQ